MDQDFVKFALYSEQSDSYSLVMHCSKCLHVFANTFFVGVLLVHEIYNALDGFAVQRYFYFLVVLICSV